MLALTTTDAMIARLTGAENVAVEAYTLRGSIVRALEDAARQGTHVAVELEGCPYHDRSGALRDHNAKVVAELREAGAVASLHNGLHAKAIAVDGALYLDERNWNRDDVVLRDDERAEWASIPSTKATALAQEARLLAHARADDGVIVESESFGTGNAVYAALKSLGCAGAAPRLLVAERDLRGAPRERAALETLARSGVQVRLCADSTKAAVSGGNVWLGSANATYCEGRWNMTDWGVCTGDRAIAGAVRARIEAQWLGAKAFRCAKA